MNIILLPKFLHLKILMHVLLNLYTLLISITVLYYFINNSSLPLESKNSVFLPTKHDFARFLIGGILMSRTCTYSKEKNHYWILRGRQVVQSAAQKCELYEDKDFDLSEVLDFPSYRVMESPPLVALTLNIRDPYKSMINKR